MRRTNITIILAASVAVLALAAAPALATFKGIGASSGTGAGSLVEFAQSSGGSKIECATVNEGLWELPTEEGATELTLEANFEGSPTNKTTTGACDVVTGTEKLPGVATVKSHVIGALLQPTKGETKLVGKLNENVEVAITVSGLKCAVTIPSASNQKIGKTVGSNSGNNLQLAPEVKGITSEAKGAGCATAGIATKSTTGELLLLSGGTALLDYINIA